MKKVFLFLLGFLLMLSSFSQNVAAAPVNAALNKGATSVGSIVTSIGSIEDGVYITDGEIDTLKYATIGSGKQWLQIDLGQQYDINEIKFWHYFGNERKYKDVVVQISNDSNFSTGVSTVFNNDTDNSSGLGVGADSEYVETKDGKQIDFSTTKGRYIRFWSNGSNINEWNHYVEVEIYGTVSPNSDIQIGSKLNIAVSKPITTSVNSADDIYATDGIIDPSKYTTIGTGPQWVELDLGQYYDINGIKFWHYFGNQRTYKDVVVEISGDLDFDFERKIVFNNDNDNSSGEGLGSDAEYIETREGKTLSFTPKKGRYLRFWSNGSNINEWNHITEIEVYGTPSPDIPARIYNVALKKSVSASVKMDNPTYAVDESIDVSKYTSVGSGLQWIKLDLGQKYDITKIKLWHYFGNNRSYKDVVVQMSNDPNFKVGVSTVFNNDKDNSAKQGIGTDEEYPESKAGKEIDFEFKTAQYLRFFSNGNSLNTFNHYGDIQVYGVPTFGDAPSPENLTLYRTISGSIAIENSAYINDSIVDATKYGEVGGGLQWVQVDLSKSYAIGKIKLWHYFGNERSYKDVIVQISNDPKFSKDVKTVFNNDVDNTAAQGIGTDLEYVETDSGKEISVSNATGRYVRFWSNGSNLNAWNHYSDIQIYKKSDKPILEIPVLMYHGIVETPKNIYQMATVNFEAQMKYLKDNGYTTLTLDEYYKMLQKSMPKPLKPVLITFDDGFANNYTTAAPILKKYNFKATVFTVANFIDTPNYFTTAQVQAMVKDGFDIASHGYNHERFEDYNYEEQLKIILDMKAKLEKITKQKMYYFAYPYGSFNTNIIKILQDQGFKLSFSSVEGFSTKVDHPFVIKRLFISGESTLDDFISILQ